MSAEQLGLVAGALLSLVLSYVPGLAPKYKALAGDQNRLIMAGLLLIVAVGAFGAACGNLVESTVTCDQEGALGLVTVFIYALVANQTTFTISPGRE